MAFIYLVIAGICETAWSYFLKESAGFSRFIPSVLTAVFMLVSLYLLALSMRSLPLSMAYVMWTGIGAVGSVLVGIFILDEPMTALKSVSLFCIIGGIIGLAH
ncbi:MAG: multidrug efflux SMR transporter [Actinomycetaceae bacterium]|nr:multidrug efflux SMR transporter [Actinomycetaceae bacterium]